MAVSHLEESSKFSVPLDLKLKEILTVNLQKLSSTRPDPSCIMCVQYHGGI